MSAIACGLPEVAPASSERTFLDSRADVRALGGGWRGHLCRRGRTEIVQAPGESIATESIER